MTSYIKSVELRCPECGHRFEVSRDQLEILIDNGSTIHCPAGDELPDNYVNSVLNPTP